MNQISSKISAPHAGQDGRSKIGNFLSAHWDLLVWTVLLLWLNRPLLGGSINSALLFQSPAVAQGQWWRILTFPLVHLSWYHLLLDGGAFLLLYNGLAEERRWIKLLIMAAGSAGSLAFGLWLSPASSQGLSGLSGIAHGLMAFSALEMVRVPQQRLWGWTSLGIVVFKSLYELASGQVLFAFMHMGMCGDPVAACHAGGVLGGLAAFVVLHGVRRLKSIQQASPAHAAL